MAGSQPLDEAFASTFEWLDDPRIDRTKKYPLNEIIFLTLYGALSGMKSWRGLEILGEERIDALREFLPFASGIPSHQTISRVFSLLKPQSFEHFFALWANRLNGSNEGRHIAIDGKTLRGSGDKVSAKEALHLLHACAVDSGITLAQLEVGAKTNEITVVPEMLDALDIKGAMISADALNTQKDIAAKIIEGGADYTLSLKGNHKHLNEQVEEIFDFADAAIKENYFVEDTEKAHGRVTTRTYEVTPLTDGVEVEKQAEWSGLKAVGRVKSSVWTSDKQTEETRYYLLSYIDATRFAQSARGHWAVESMHWALDVTFSEDASQKRKDHAPRNYSLIRKFSLNILRTFKGKLSVPNAQFKAALNQEFMKMLLVNSGFRLMSTDI